MSVQLPTGTLPANFKYCDPRMENPPTTPYTMIVDGEERPLVEGINSRFQPAFNIHLNENSRTIEIIRTCASLGVENEN